MGFRDWFPWMRPAEKRALTLDQWIRMDVLDTPTAAGVQVSEGTALTFAAYWCAVNLIASSVAKLPRKVYKKNGDEREEVGDHPVGRVVGFQPNRYMTPINFWRTFVAHVLTWGNAYAEIEWNRAQQPIALWPITPDKIEPVMEKGVLLYRYRGGERLLSPEDVLHVPGLGFDGVKGYSVVQMAKQSIGLGLAAERYGATFFGNGAMPGMTLEHPGSLSPEAQRRLRESWNAMHQGPDKAHRLAILEEGMKANPLSIPAKDAQLIETREVQVLEVARWLNINPAMLGYKTAERPGGNYEANRLDFLDNTLDPWLVAIEQEVNRKLISSAQEGTFYVEHVRNAVLRTDARTRADVQKVYVDMGVMTPEYVAKIENLPKPPEPEPVPEPLAVPPQDEEDDEESQDVEEKARALIVDIVARYGRREAEQIRRAVKKGSESLGKWADEFYAREIPELSERLRPAVALVYAAAGRKDDPAHAARMLADDYLVRSRSELLDLRAADLEPQAEALIRRWASARPTEAAGAVFSRAKETSNV